MFDPLGAPVEGMLVSIESGPFGSGVSDELLTDKTGSYKFEKLAPGVYTVSMALEFAPTIEVPLSAGELRRQDLHIRIDEVTATYSVCVDCEPGTDRYSPPESLVREFASDREALAQQAVRGAEPIAGWEAYEPDVQVTPVVRERGLTGTVVLEGRVEADGSIAHITAVSSPHDELSAAAIAALRKERWRPAMVRGVAVASPLRLTIEFLRRAKPAR